MDIFDPLFPLVDRHCIFGEPLIVNWGLEGTLDIMVIPKLGVASILCWNFIIQKRQYSERVEHNQSDLAIYNFIGRFPIENKHNTDILFY